MTDLAPLYRFRGHVQPSAEVSRPVAVHKNAASAADGDKKGETSATIDIFDVIDSYGGWWGISAAEVDAAMKQIGDVDTLYVRLNSPGGEATEGVAIANLLRANTANVRVTVFGLAASAASMIAVAGDVVNMAPGSILMIHDALNIIYGNADEMRKSAGLLDTISDSYAGLYAAKAGGSASTWRTLMREDKWYSADAAVAAKLADAVGLDPTLPANLPPVEEQDDDDKQVIEIDVNVNPAARAAAKRFDLSMLPNAAAALAPKLPAEPQETPTTDTKEADAMSDTLNEGLRKRLGVADDADEATILSALDEALAEQADDKPAADAGKPAEAVIPEGKMLVDKAQWADVVANAQRGAAAAKRQDADDRDTAIAKAVKAGKISAALIDDLKSDWDADVDAHGNADQTRKRLDEMAVIYPVAKAGGYQGDATPRGDVDLTGDEAAGFDAFFSGVSA